MIKVICGEDTVAARDYFNKLKKSFEGNNCQIIEINPSNVNQIMLQIDCNLSLFNKKIIYFAQFLSPILTKNKNLLNKIIEINKSKDIFMYIFEDKKKYNLTLYKNFPIVEFKLHRNIFTLLDLFLPGKRNEFLKLFHQIANEKNLDMFFYLLSKRIRDLLIIKNRGQLEKIPSWQLTKLKKQAQSWEEEKLIAVYQSLFRIEIDRKTSQTPFTLSDAIDILAYYHLS